MNLFQYKKQTIIRFHKVFRINYQLQYKAICTKVMNYIEKCDKGIRPRQTLVLNLDTSIVIKCLKHAMISILLQ